MKTIDKKNRNYDEFDPNGRNEDQDPASRSNDRNGSRDPRYNKNTDKHRDPDSKTFNEDDESWENKQNNAGTRGNDWDANNAVERSNNYRYDDEQRDASAGDYIKSDHSEYNRGISRFGWFEPEGF